MSKGQGMIKKPAAMKAMKAMKAKKAKEASIMKAEESLDCTFVRCNESIDEQIEKGIDNSVNEALFNESLDLCESDVEVIRDSFMRHLCGRRTYPKWSSSC